MKYKLNIKDMVFIIIVTMILVLMGLDYLGVDLSISLPNSDEDTSMSPSGAMSGAIN